ncbi:MAG TPA: ABC transporter permease [Acetobacteraceae bacterium]|jgi:peptide/nickel transport system permease protein|nr:ABC transporter permease [Acetobacteraceae bacterium]
MLGFLIRRLLALVLTLVAASFLVFAVTQFSPSNVARETLGAYALPEQVHLLYEKLQLGDPLVVRYVRWAGVLLGLRKDPLDNPALGLNITEPHGGKFFGNFGYSTLFRVPVGSIIWNRLGNTAILAGIAFAIIVPLSMLLGILAGMRPGSPMDRALSVTAISMTSMPEYAIGVILAALFAVWLKALPGTSPLAAGTGWSLSSQYALPVAVLVLYDSGYVARMVRASMIDVLNRPFVRTAVLKGLPRRRVILRHALRNAMIAPFTVILLQINWLIGGVVVTETVFAYPGFGRMLLEASLFGDISLIEAATLIALVVAIGTQLLSDVGYWLLDPQVRG